MDDDPFSGFGLQPIRLTDQARFTACFASLVEPLSDYTFSQLFTWGNSLRIVWKEIRGHLCVFANGTGDLTMLMPPIGDGGGDGALAEAFEIMDAYNRASGADGGSRVEYASEELLRRFSPSRLRLQPMGADYVYDTARMIDLAGGDLASKRQLKTRFLRNYSHRVERFEYSRHIDGCRQLLKLWKHQQDAQHNCEKLISALKRQKEVLACELAVEYADALGLKGMVVYVKPNPLAQQYGTPAARELSDSEAPANFSIRAFTFGEALGNQQSSIVIEKTDLGVKGLAQFIFSEFCARDWADRPLVNAGDDWGLPSLAWTKMSYRPVKLLQKCAFGMAAPAAVSMPAAIPSPDMAEPLARSAVAEAPCSSGHQLLLFPEISQPWEPSVVAGCESVVRLARKEDVTAAVQIEQACFSAHRLSRRQLQYLQGRSSAVFLVAESAGHILGQGICLVRQHRRGQSGRIYSLAVHSAARRRKIGQRLLHAMIDGLAARGVKRIYLEVEQANGPAIELYERNGFRRIGILPDYYGAAKPALHMMFEPSGALAPEPAASSAAGAGALEPA